MEKMAFGIIGIAWSTGLASSWNFKIQVRSFYIAMRTPTKCTACASTSKFTPCSSLTGTENLHGALILPLSNSSRTPLAMSRIPACICPHMPLQFQNRNTMLMSYSTKWQLQFFPFFPLVCLSSSWATFFVCFLLRG